MILRELSHVWYVCQGISLFSCFFDDEKDGIGFGMKVWMHDNVVNADA